MIPCERKDCTGCGVCVSVCAFGAILFTQDERGFLVPQVDSGKCQSCGRCERVCPGRVLPPPRDVAKKVYAAWTTNDAERLRATSGGIFRELAVRVLRQGGEVWGVVLDSDFVARHVCVAAEEDLVPCFGSKYLQSDASAAYPRIKDSLVAGKRVFFTGTPCQCAAIRNYLGKDYDSLLTMDFVCHGAPSPGIFQTYVKDYLPRRLKSPVKSYRFRVKERGWGASASEIQCEDGSIHYASFYSDPYLIAFTQNYVLNEACYTCRHANLNRVSDITVSDYWGYVSRKYKYRNTNQGVSMLMGNTKKGLAAIESLADSCVLVPTSLTEGVEGNACLRRPSRRAKRSDDFWKLWEESHHDWNRCAEELFPARKPSKRLQISSWINDHMYLLPSFAQNAFYALKRRLKR